jgi:hypothetical protein
VGIELGITFGHNFTEARYPSGKGVVCKTIMRRFDSDSCLQTFRARINGSIGPSESVRPEIANRAGRTHPVGPKNDERTRTERALEALHDHMEGLGYLAGVMSMLPKSSVRHNEGGAILVQGWQLNRDPELGANFIRKLRLHTKKSSGSFKRLRTGSTNEPRWRQ